LLLHVLDKDSRSFAGFDFQNNTIPAMPVGIVVYRKV
jgi:hypothetical protein